MNTATLLSRCGHLVTDLVEWVSRVFANNRVAGRWGRRLGQGVKGQRVKHASLKIKMVGTYRVPKQIRNAAMGALVTTIARDWSIFGDLLRGRKGDVWKLLSSHSEFLHR